MLATLTLRGRYWITASRASSAVKEWVRENYPPPHLTEKVRALEAALGAARADIDALQAKLSPENE